MLDKNFAIVDVETTGGGPKNNRVIEIGILRIEKGELVGKYQSLINPGMEIPEYITHLTGITNRKVKKAPIFEDIKDDVLDYFEDAVFVAHNCSFDYGFMKQEFKRVDYAFSCPRLCTVSLSRVLFPEFKHHNLSAIVERCNFVCKNRHRAYDDAKVLWDFFQYLPSKFSEAEIRTAMNRTLKRIPPAKQRKMGKIETDEISYIPEDLAFEF
jgi:DNA polymerase III subunit epsilon